MPRLAIRVQPGAQSNEIAGWITDAHGGEVLRTAVFFWRSFTAVRRTNAALIEFLAEILGLRPRQITLERGDKSHEKLISVEGLTREAIRQRILQ
jgi:uncharacterized protein YggU (UPF0235/DUF167 family)